MEPARARSHPRRAPLRAPAFQVARLSAAQGAVVGGRSGRQGDSVHVTVPARRPRTISRSAAALRDARVTAPMHGFGGLSAPFPGLRAFEAEEALLFYGRERHVAELLDRLGDSRFVAVTGTSGSGKSSLVRAGLRPALHRGYLVDASSRWRFATMRPGGAPIQALAQALADALGTPNESILPLAARDQRRVVAGRGQCAARPWREPAPHRRPVRGAVPLRRHARRSRATRRCSSACCSKRPNAATPPIYVVVTMRSEFLGRCSEFTGLAEAFNRSQYLVPRLTRDERREAIERPLRLFGTEPTPALVQQVLNDAGDDPDQLPVMQHALLRTYREWERAGATGRIEQRHYDAVGGIERALDRHGDEILRHARRGAAQKTAERLLRSLTVSQGGVALRRPRLLAASLRDCRRGHAGPAAPRRRHRRAMFAARRQLLPDAVVAGADSRHGRRHHARERDSKVEAAQGLGARREPQRRMVRRPVARRGALPHRRGQPLAGSRARRACSSGSARTAGTRHGRTSIGAPTIRLSKRSCRSSTESERKQAERRRHEEEQRDRELRHAQALAAAKRRQAAVLALLLVGVVAAALMLSAWSRRIASWPHAAATVQRLSSESQSAASRLRTLEAEQAALKIAAPSVATPADKARLQQLTQEIESAKAQAQGSQDELAKLKKNQDLNASDRGRLLQQIETLNQRLTQTTADRDRLQNQLNARPSTPPVTQQKDTTPANDDRVAVLQRQLDDERKQSADEIARLKNQLAAASNESQPRRQRRHRTPASRT